MIVLIQDGVQAAQQSGSIHLTLRDILEISAIFLGPIMALWIQRVLDRLREAKRQQLDLYFTLMRLRGAHLTPDFVNALNLIDIVFNHSSKKELEIRSKWKALMDHYNAKQSEGDGWADKRLDLTIDLLNAIGSHLGFTFDPSHLKRQVYFPQAFSEQWQETNRLRKSLLEVLDGNGKRKIPVAIFESKFPDTK